MLTRNLRGTCKVPIGTNYRRPWFENRTPTDYQSFNGPMTNDCVRLQGALLAKPGPSTRAKVGFFVMTMVGISGYLYTVLQ